MPKKTKPIVRISPTKARKDLYNLISHVSDGDYDVVIENTKTSDTVVISRFEDNTPAKKDDVDIEKLAGSLSEYSRRHEFNSDEEEEEAMKKSYLEAIVKRVFGEDSPEYRSLKND